MRYFTHFQIMLVLFTLNLLPLQISAQPRDVEGWNKARWGMTEKKIENAFKGKIERRPEPIIDEQDGIYVNLEIHNFTFANTKFTVSFVMDDKTDQLKEVVLSPETTHFRVLFGILERKLVAKYGPVTHKDKDGSGQDQIMRLWRFPSTTITLQYWVYGAGSGKVSEGVALMYRENVESKDKR